jgi:hypothetical protein
MQLSDWSALTPALSPRREPPDILTRFAPLNPERGIYAASTSEVFAATNVEAA